MQCPQPLTAGVGGETKHDGEEGQPRHMPLGNALEDRRGPPRPQQAERPVQDHVGGARVILGLDGQAQRRDILLPSLGVGAGERRPYVLDNQLTIATVMTVTGSFDHRAIDGAVGAELMGAFKRLVERPITMLA